jgi:tRNA(Ile2) C34 agmatinyltransferase TiaS
MTREQIEEKVQRVLEKRSHANDGDIYVKQCLETSICPSCGEGLATTDGRNFWCPGCKMDFSVYLYYNNEIVEKWHMPSLVHSLKKKEV